MGWEIYPQGLRDLLIGIHQEYAEHGLPEIYIVENRVAFPDKVEEGRVHDQKRVNFVRAHLNAVAEAKAAGVNIQGHFYWSLMDSFGWNSGYLRRFGLYYVDYETQQRIPKDSALWYRDWIRVCG